MSEVFLGAIGIFSFSFAPKGWAFCSGQLLPIDQNQALYSLLGTTYGGNGQTNFALPNLNGSCIVGTGSSPSGTYQQGQRAGEATHTLLAAENPLHLHSVNADTTVAASNNSGAPAGNTVLGQSAASAGTDAYSLFVYANAASDGTALAASAIGFTGGQPHANMMPSLGLNYAIALIGIYPTRP